MLILNVDDKIRKSCPRRLPCGLRGEAAAVGDGAVGPSETGPVIKFSTLSYSEFSLI